MKHSNIEEVVVFIGKAQHKIAELGGIIANEEENPVVSQLLLDLLNFLESLQSPYNNWKEKDVIRYIHYWNKRADLNNVPYIQILEYEVYIRGVGSNPDLSGIEDTIKDIISKYSHNLFSGIQGGSTTERYHLTKAQLDWLDCQMQKSPCPDVIQPTINLELIINSTLWPSGYYELGVAIPNVVLTGSYVLNSGKKLLSYTYERGNSILASGTDPINPFTDRTPISKDTTYALEATFSIGGIKRATKNIKFMQPMYSGILRKDAITPRLATGLTKNVRDKGYMELSYTLPKDNTLKPIGQELVPVFFIPESWGIPTSIKVLDYEFKNDWQFTPSAMILADGSSVLGILAVYTKAFEGTTVFKLSY